MIQVTPQMRIRVAVEPADFRKGIDGLACVCREVLRSDPFSGCLFVFCNKSRKAIKILVYDGQGFWLCQKRLSKGRFPWWPHSVSAVTEALEAHQLTVLLSGGNPEAAKGVRPWRRVDVVQ
ncbi:MAG TPA: IS66 family insertion sequence element accessory protein TnpB [Sedimentisphaerales bacterium]|nr:IS66 family insertion sequence element accessory protein TnpB [Sedimentisphaerales bacterium]